jgi:hypothetical protein
VDLVEGIVRYVNEGQPSTVDTSMLVENVFRKMSLSFPISLMPTSSIKVVARPCVGVRELRGEVERTDKPFMHG